MVAPFGMGQQGHAVFLVNSLDGDFGRVVGLAGECDGAHGSVGDEDFASVLVCVNDEKSAFVAAFNVADGSEIWSRKTDALPVKCGVALHGGGSGQFVVALENGRVICFADGK